MGRSVNVQLTEDQALILFDWLVRFNERDDEHFEDQAEERVLWDLESSLEEQLAATLAADYQSILSAARDAVRDVEE
ncbi:MAG: hypothetical protein VX223_05260 [Myxococcota bacterium]|nr:hypothetical protein [Myxococcota bacterium]